MNDGTNLPMSDLRLVDLAIAPALGPAVEWTGRVLQWSAKTHRVTHP
jgi:hypothetical protein